MKKLILGTVIAAASAGAFAGTQSNSVTVEDTVMIAPTCSIVLDDSNWDTLDSAKDKWGITVNTNLNDKSQAKLSFTGVASEVFDSAVIKSADGTEVNSTGADVALNTMAKFNFDGDYKAGLTGGQLYKSVATVTADCSYKNPEYTK